MDANLEDFQSFEDIQLDRRTAEATFKTRSSLIADQDLAASGHLQEQYNFQETLGYGAYGRARLGEFAKTIANNPSQPLSAPTSVSGRDLRVVPDNTSLRERLGCVITGPWRRWVLQRIGDEWVFLMLLGIVAALNGYLMDLVVDKFRGLHMTLMNVSDIVGVQYILWTLFMVLMTLAAVAVTHYIEPNAIGSGIPEMKTILKGINLHHYLSFTTLIAKITGLIVALGSGIPIGKEGPFVHIASIIAKKLMNVPVFHALRDNEARKLEMLGAACAVGVACNFGTPIGGVLFSIEVTSTYFAVRNYWRGFFAAVVGALLFRLLAVYDQANRTITTMFDTDFNDFAFDVEELLAFCVVGLCCGLLASLWVWMHRAIIHTRRKYRHKMRWMYRNRFIYPFIVALLTATLMFPGGIGEYMGLSTKQLIRELFSSNQDSNCGASQQHDQPNPLDVTFPHWGNPNLFVALIVSFLIRFLLTTIVVSLPIPAGVFVPVFLLGAIFGRLFGEVMQLVFPAGIQGPLSPTTIDPGGYAVVGAAALAAGVTHTISTSVIVFELTGQIVHIMPVMIAVLIANAVAQLLTPSIYDSIIQIKSLPYLPDLRKGRAYNVKARDIMEPAGLLLHSKSTYADVERMLHDSTHASFPVIDSLESTMLIGSVRRTALESVLVRHLSVLDTVAVSVEDSDSGRDDDDDDDEEEGRDHAGNSNGEQPLLKRKALPDRDLNSSVTSTSSIPRSVSFALANETDDEDAKSRKIRMQVALSQRSISDTTPQRQAQLVNASRSSAGQAGRQSPIGRALARLSVSLFNRSGSIDTNTHQHGAHSLDLRRKALLDERLNFGLVRIDASPFQMVDNMSLHKVHTLFSLLGLTHAFVTRMGRVVGIITLSRLRDAIEGTMEMAIADERDAYAALNGGHHHDHGNGDNSGDDSNNDGDDARDSDSGGNSSDDGADALGVDREEDGSAPPHATAVSTRAKGKLTTPTATRRHRGAGRPSSTSSVDRRRPTSSRPSSTTSGGGGRNSRPGSSSTVILTPTEAVRLQEKQREGKQPRPASRPGSSIAAPPPTVSPTATPSVPASSAVAASSSPSVAAPPVRRGRFDVAPAESPRTVTDVLEMDDLTAEETLADTMQTVVHGRLRLNNADDD